MRPTQTIPGLMSGLETSEAFAGRRHRKGRKLARKGKPGRPKAEKKHRKADGERLRAALSLFGYRSEAEAALHAGISQGTLNGIINGRRGIGLEDLRALSKIGIPADYILGLKTELVPLGQTRTKASLEADVALHVEREIGKRHPPSPAGAKGAYQWRVSGQRALAVVVDKLSVDAAQELAREGERERLSRTTSALGDALDQLILNWPRVKKKDGATRTIYRLIRLLETMTEQFGALPPGGTPILLVPEEFIKLPVKP